MQLKIVAMTVVTITGLTAPANAQSKPEAAVLFQDVRIFDGRRASLSAPTNVLVRGNKIERISSSSIAEDNASTTAISGNGHTLMPEKTTETS